MQIRRIKDWAPDDTLEHHGIKGQRWGVRRYQNPDGSLTDAGRKRYGTSNKYLSADDVENISARTSVARTATAFASFGSAAGLLYASSVSAPPFTLPLALGGLAMSVGTFASDKALKKIGDKKIEEAKPLLSEAQSYIYDKMDKAQKTYEETGDLEAVKSIEKWRATSQYLSRGENAGKKYAVTENKDGSTNFESQEFINFKKAHPKLKGDKLNEAYAKTVNGEYIEENTKDFVERQRQRKH